MDLLSANDQLTAISTQLTGMSELFRILSEYDLPIRSELFEFLSFSTEQLGAECSDLSKQIGSEADS